MVVKPRTYRLKLNLQTFAEGDTAPTPAPITTPVAEPTPPPAPPQENIHHVVTSKTNSFAANGDNNPLRANPNPTVTPQPPATPPATPPADTLLDFGGRKVPVVDPSLQALHGDWQEMNRTLTRLQEENRIAQQRIQLFEQQQTTPAQSAHVADPTPTQPQMPNEERIKQLDEQYNDMLYEKGKIAADLWLYAQDDYKTLIRDHQASIVQDVLTTQQKEQQEKTAKLQSEAERLNSQYPDFGTVLTDMEAVVQKFPHLANVENMETVYFMAKGMRQPEPAATPQAPQPLTIQQILADPALKQQLMQDQTLRNEIISGYINDRKEQQSGIPVPMGSTVGGQPPTLPPNKPTSLGEASSQARKWFASRMAPGQQ